MRATRKQLTTGAAGLSAALLLLLAACGEPTSEQSSEGTVAPAAGTEEPAATTESPATEEPAPAAQ